MSIDCISPFFLPFSGRAAQEFVDGEIIYHRGEQHPMCFFVHKGVVRLEYADGTIETKVRWGVARQRKKYSRA